jgi:hypothetical protein
VMVVGCVLRSSRQKMREQAKSRQLPKSLLPKDMATLNGRHLAVSVQSNDDTTMWKHRI